MTRCWNSDDLRGAFREVFQEANEVRVALGQYVAADTTEKQRHEDRDKLWLECHARDFIVDQILAALNWRLRPLMDARDYAASNLVIEQSHGGARAVRVRAGKEEHKRRLDYLGYDTNTDRPLLIVEAKRPNLQLPSAQAPLALPDAHPSASLIAGGLDTLRGNTAVSQPSLTSAWMNVLSQVSQYCQSVAMASDGWPPRAAITNGEWFILFTNLENAFAASATTRTQSHSIFVFESSEKLLEHHSRLWALLEYGALAKLDHRIHVARVPFYVDPDAITGCSYGLRISYTDKYTNYRKAPVLSASPLLFVRSSAATFIQVVSDWDQEMPADGRGSISEHIEQVAAEAARLKRDLEDRVLGGRTLPLISVAAHCEDREALRVRPLVQTLQRPIGQQGFLLLTGTSPHYVLPTSEYRDCEFHCHADARARSVAQGGSPVLESSISPKSHFIDGDHYHCAHRDTYGVKREPVTEANQSRCGHRSSTIGGAFCELWQFEEFLCCRACALHSACSKATAFFLPCSTSVSLTRHGMRL